MKPVRTLLPALLAIGGLAAGHLASRPALEASGRANQDLAGRVDQLEEQQRATAARMQSMAADLATQRKLMDQTVEYLGRQAAQAEAMVGVLAESEERGFTAGINPKSREVLLAGLREQLGETQRGVPGAKPEATTEAAPRR